MERMDNLDLDNLSHLDLEDLEDFRKLQAHKGWGVWWALLLQLLTDSRKEILNSETPEEAWRAVQKSMAIEGVIGLRDQLLKRRETEREFRDDEQRRIAIERRHRESELPGLAGGFELDGW